MTMNMRPTHPCGPFDHFSRLYGPARGIDQCVDTRSIVLIYQLIGDGSAR